MSYFVLLRTLFKLNIVLFLLMFIFVVLPNVVQFTSDGYTTAVTGSNIGGVDAAAAVTCSAGYEVNVSSDAASVIQDFLQGTVSLSPFSCIRGCLPLYSPFSSIRGLKGDNPLRTKGDSPLIDENGLSRTS